MPHDIVWSSHGNRENKHRMLPRALLQFLFSAEDPFSTVSEGYQMYENQFFMRL